MTVPAKPLYGEACNSCGRCCIASQCPLSTMFFGEQYLCPALEQTETGFGCGLIRAPGEYLGPPWRLEHTAEAFATILGAGTGCDAVMTDADHAVADQPEARALTVQRARAAYLEASPAARALIDHISPGNPFRDSL